MREQGQTGDPVLHHPQVQVTVSTDPWPAPAMSQAHRLHRLTRSEGLVLNLTRALPLVLVP